MIQAKFNQLWSESAMFRVGVVTAAVVVGLLIFLPQPQPPATASPPAAVTPWLIPGSDRPASSSSVPGAVVKGASEVIATGARATGDVLGAVLNGPGTTPRSLAASPAPPK